MHNQNKILRVLQLISLLKSAPPKRMQYLATVMASTERTVYRYIDLLTEVGFVIERDNQNRVFISADNDDLELRFTQEEMQLMRQLLQTVGKKNPLKDGILKKLYINSEQNLNADHLLKAHLGRLVELLTEGIHQQKQVVLRQYQSVNSNLISDRLVEPICFTDNYQNLCAFEPESGKNKFFNIERIGTVEVTRKNFKFRDQHKYGTPDAFGFSESDKKYLIKMELSLRAQILLKEQFPMTASLIIPNKKSATYLFTATVNNLKPVTRFVLGLPEEVTILGSDEFIRHLNKYVNKLFK